jgi:hypothetical protein
MMYEKFEMFENALDFCEAGLNDDILKGGSYATYAFILTHCCKGRVLSKLSRFDEACAQFATAVNLSQAHNYPFFEAIALRDWGNALPSGSQEASSVAKQFAAAMSPLGLDCREAIAECIAQVFMWRSDDTF